MNTTEKHKEDLLEFGEVMSSMLLLTLTKNVTVADLYDALYERFQANKIMTARTIHFFDQDGYPVVAYDSWVFAMMQGMYLKLSNVPEFHHRSLKDFYEGTGEEDFLLVQIADVDNVTYFDFYALNGQSMSFSGIVAHKIFYNDKFRYTKRADGRFISDHFLAVNEIENNASIADMTEAFKRQFADKIYSEIDPNSAEYRAEFAHFRARYVANLMEAQGR